MTQPHPYTLTELRRHPHPGGFALSAVLQSDHQVLARIERQPDRPLRVEYLSGAARTELNRYTSTQPPVTHHWNEPCELPYQIDDLIDALLSAPQTRSATPLT